MFVHASLLSLSPRWQLEHSVELLAMLFSELKFVTDYSSLFTGGGGGGGGTFPQVV